MNPLAVTLAASPELFPLSLNLQRERVTLVRLSRAEYEQASFLDGRIAGPAKPCRSLPLAELRTAVTEAGLPENCHFIFHIGHVGSTLLSRLLGRHSAIFSLREPDVLRTLALAQNQATVATHLPVFVGLWSRTFDPGARALVKASSFVSDLAAQILTRDYAPKALVLGVAPETYMATIFGGANAPAEARALAPFRLARLRARLGCDWRLEHMSQGEIVALGWACEASALATATAQSAARVHVMNFDAFLAQPPHHLKAAFAHFGVSVSEAEIARILAGSEMQTYSKAPEYAYDAALRRSVLDEGRGRFDSEIRRGLSFIESAARQFPQIADAISLFGN
jgi:hypothetical protein